MWPIDIETGEWGAASNHIIINSSPSEKSNNQDDVGVNRSK